jgi:hypothetical protein
MKQLFSLLFFCFFSSVLLGQSSDSLRRFKTMGALAGYGHAFSDNTNYDIYYLAGDWSWSFSKAKRRDFLSLYFEPQVNIVRTDRPWDLEFGANLGLRNYIRINDGFYLYQMLGSGPHFITAELDRQATGFIFSDNLFLGALTRLKESVFLNVQFGVRHISNAGLKLPNRGVNSWNFRLGISRRK